MISIKRACLQAMVFVFALSFTVRADIIYNVSRTVGTGSVNGTIETDGTVGTLVVGNILDWDLTLNIPTAGSYVLTGPLSGSDSVVYIGGFGSITSVSATASDLDFNFSGVDGGLLLFQNGLFQGGPYYCVASPFADPGACSPGETVGLSAFQNDTPTGTVIIGTAGTTTPEPTVMMLTGLGLAFLAFVANRRRRAV